MTRRKPAAQENHDRWLVSYADFITLLFAFFVVMFASTQGNRAKARQVSESVRAALERGQLSVALATVLGKGKHEIELTTLAPRPEAQTSGGGLKLVERGLKSPGGAARDASPVLSPLDLAKSAEILQQVLATEVSTGKLAIRLESRGLVISLREAGFFASGDDRVAPSSASTLAKIARVMQALPNAVRLEGHTDSIPIHTARFPSNWELSTARAIATMDVLADQYQIPRSRMAVAGYAENMPADSNETPEGRARNRRVDIVLLTQAGMREEPSTPPPPEAGGSVPSQIAKEKPE